MNAAPKAAFWPHLAPQTPGPARPPPFITRPARLHSPLTTVLPQRARGAASEPPPPPSPPASRLSHPTPRPRPGASSAARIVAVFARAAGGRQSTFHCVTGNPLFSSDFNPRPRPGESPRCSRGQQAERARQREPEGKGQGPKRGGPKLKRAKEEREKEERDKKERARSRADPTAESPLLIEGAERGHRPSCARGGQ